MILVSKTDIKDKISEIPENPYRVIKNQSPGIRGFEI